MNPDPVKLGFVFLGAACTSLGFGAMLIRLAWNGFRNGSYPLSNTSQLTGTPARLVALAIGAVAVLAITCGIVILVFGFFRMKQLLR